MVPQTTTATALPPGPRLSAFQQLVYRPGAGNPLPFFTNLARTYGDVVTYRMAGEQVFLVSDPHLIKDILVTHHRNFLKGRGLQRAKRLLGEGLLTSEGQHHLRQRRLMQPAFHRDRIARTQVIAVPAVHLQNRRTLEFDRPVQKLFAGFDIYEHVDMRISPIHVRYGPGKVDSLTQIELAGDLVMRPRGSTAKQ